MHAVHTDRQVTQMCTHFLTFLYTDTHIICTRYIMYTNYSKHSFSPFLNENAEAVLS